ncbi:MAG TPA: caspase family protein [Burkholderiaceae bacterium]|nr:caspase family protein [Burkholderiaceae bacterium]
MKRWLGLVLFLLGASCLAAGMRGVAVTEERIALVIGNAAYRNDPLDNPVNDARLIAKSLQQSGFAVTLKENLDRTALLNSLREFGQRLNENTIAVLYYAGHGLQLRDHNYLMPVDADIRSEDEIPISGMDLSFILGRMSHARSRVNIVILDACRNNPFAGKTVPVAQGLAQMDAPVGTLLAFATAPGKLAADSGGAANSLYAEQLARQLLTPGLPVEHVFKRVREAVVRETKAQQVPWESSSLQGEFAFVPGSAAPAQATADVEAAGELAFWNSIQASQRADEYRAYLRQYPRGRFVALAQTRIAAFSAPPPSAAAPAQSQAPSVAATLPRVGDSWRYKVQDQFRFGDLFVTAKVDAVSAQGISETWTTTADAKVRSILAPLEPGFVALPEWTATPAEFAPYLQASGALRPGARLPDVMRRVEQWNVPLKASVEGEEEVVVGAGRFRATKLVLRGQLALRGARSGVSIEQVVWYASEAKRSVKATVSTTVGGALREATTFELVEFKLN